MLLDRSARGAFVIAPTPFLPDGALDLASAARMTEAYLAMGAAGITILGVMGEAPKLTAEEALRFARTVLAANAGQLPVLVGVPASGFAPMRALAQAVMEAGAAGVMIAPPPGLRGGDEAVLAWLAEASAAVAPAPWCLQDYPQAHGVAITPAMVARLAASDPRLVMLKAEDWPGLDKISALRALEAAGEMPRLAILGGNSGLFLPEELARGTDGVMTGYAFPELLIAACREGPTEALWERFEAHLPLIRFDNQPGLGLAVRKHILTRRGLIAHETLRPPAPRLSEASRAEVAFLLRRLARRDPLAASLA
ncbi:MAG: dihydrodipicolinate synthase family protein [Rhodovarius sp.]|nr:dihydrodipicolinate synthase family protein [Rhodovarius sp.]